MSNQAERINPQLPILDVKPLNSVPYIGPPTSHGNAASQQEVENEAVERGPSILYLPSHWSEQWDQLLEVSKSGIGLTGSAAMGMMGPAIGAVDIGESDDSYLFRVSLPGVSRDEKDFKCDVEADGKVLIRGITTMGEKTVVKESEVFKMTQNMCPPGHFSLSFQLPGPVDRQQLTGFFGTSGVLEGIVKKR